MEDERAKEQRARQAKRSSTGPSLALQILETAQEKGTINYSIGQDKRCGHWYAKMELLSGKVIKSPCMDSRAEAEGELDAIFTLVALTLGGEYRTVQIEKEGEDGVH